jgi:endonuclease-3
MSVKNINRKNRIKAVIDYFTETLPEPETELSYENPYELIVSVILSAQCTDKRVNMITPALFRKFPGPLELARASQEEVFELIRSCSYPNNKASHLRGMAKVLTEEFGGRVPRDVAMLPVMPVDTHVFRVAARIGLTRNARTPLQAENQLYRVFPQEMIPRAHHWLILHGRYICQARKPKCEECGLTGVCRFYLHGKKAPPKTN